MINGALSTISSKLVTAGLLCVTALTLITCLEPYHSPNSGSGGNLVVDGFLLGPADTTTIRLNRTTQVGVDAQPIVETGATIRIEGSDGSQYPLIEQQPGTYSAVGLPVESANFYRLHITTANKSDYTSDMVPFRNTPSIDSIYWTYEDGTVNIRVDTHDSRKETTYYMWRFTETWSYHSAYKSTVRFDAGTVYQRTPSELIFNCWKSEHSTSVLLGSSAQLSEDFIHGQILNPVPLISDRFGTLYTINVSQYALTKDAFEYWQQLKKNTENIGTIFGPQPSQIISNIHNVTNSGETVVGYFSACSLSRQRIWIANEDVPRSRHDSGYDLCEQDTLAIQYVPDYTGGSLLISEAFVGTTLVGYSVSTAYCVDCRLHGGSTSKPIFWP